MIIYVLLKNGGNENSPYSLNVMVNYHYHSENRVITRYFPSIPGGGRRQRGIVYICGVVPTAVVLCGVYSGWVPIEGTQPGNTQISFRVTVLEGKYCDTT